MLLAHNSGRSELREFLHKRLPVRSNQIQVQPNRLLVTFREILIIHFYLNFESMVLSRKTMKTSRSKYSAQKMELTSKSPFQAIKSYPTSQTIIFSVLNL